MEERVSHHVNISLRKLVNWSISQHVEVSLVLVTIFYVVVFLCGVVGNLLVCVVIARSKCLHSAMNYYLISLALADLILLILGKATGCFYCWFPLEKLIYSEYTQPSVFYTILWGPSHKKHLLNDCYLNLALSLRVPQSCCIRSCHLIYI